MASTASSRRPLAILALGIAIALVLLLVMTRDRGSSQPELTRGQPRPSAGDAPRERPPSAVALDPGQVPIDESETPADRIVPDRPAAPPPLPPDTQMLAEETVPGTTEWDDAPLDEAGESAIRILPRRYNVVLPEPIVVLLEQRDTATNTRQAMAKPKVRVRPMDDPQGAWVDVPISDDGRGEDEQAGDLLYTASLRPDAATRDRLLGRVVIEGSVEHPELGRRVIPATLIYTRGARARLTGKWRDYVKDGHLFLETDLVVDDPGLFTLALELFGPQLEPIAWARDMRELGAGKQTMTVRVWGKALTDRGIDGPYRVRDVLLTRDRNEKGDYDPAPTIIEAHRTAAYKASQFSPAIYVDAARPPEVPANPNEPPPENQRVLLGP